MAEMADSRVDRENLKCGMVLILDCPTLDIYYVFSQRQLPLCCIFSGEPGGGSRVLA